MPFSPSYRVAELMIKVGSNSRDSNSGILYGVEKYVIAPKHFSNGTYAKNDMVLVKTKAAIDYLVDEVRNMYVINSICLPKDGIINPDDEYARFAGFGIIKDSKEIVLPRLLQKVGGVIYDPLRGRRACKRGFEMICFEMDKNAMNCMGDSGSPLIQYDGYVAVVIGVNSFAKGGTPGFPCGTLTAALRVSYYVDSFIRKALEKY